MFGIFKKKEKKPKPPELNDLNNTPLREGDIVEALRYDLGKCKVALEHTTYYYISLNDGRKVSWLKMIDASTDNQKVKKVDVD